MRSFYQRGPHATMEDTQCGAGRDDGGTAEEPPKKKRRLANGNVNRLIYLAHRDWGSIVRYGSIRLEAHHKCRVTDEVLYDPFRFLFQPSNVQLLS